MWPGTKLCMITKRDHERKREEEKKGEDKIGSLTQQGDRIIFDVNMK